jgi:hypothetical protein
VAGGFALGIAVAASSPERWAAILQAVQGVEWYIAAALVGISAIASAKNAKDDPPPPQPRTEREP